MKPKTSFLLFTLLAILLSACGNSAEPSPTAPAREAGTTVVKHEEIPVTEDVQDNTAAISVEDLMNAAYSGVYDDAVTLTNGLYEGEPFVEGDPARPILQYVEGRELFGDLDGDGIEDAVVFLIDRGGGTAAFTFIAAQLNQNGQPVDAGAVMVTDRTQILDESIVDGKVLLDFTTRGPGDVDCCPSYKTRRVYTLESGKLVDISSEDQDMVRISADDLNGTSWTLLELNYDVPALEDSEVTISFQDNQISGSGGCNNYNSSFNLNDDNPFIITLDPVIATKKACPDQVLNQEAAYFMILESISLWGYDHGNLVLFYVDEQGEYSRLLFTSQ